MDKYDLVLDIVEHPDKYTTQQLSEILSDPETREIYNLLCKTESAVTFNNHNIDVDAEWERFAAKRALHRHRFFMWAGNRAASIAAIVCTSIAAMAAGIAVTVSVMESSKEPVVDIEEAPIAETPARAVVADTIVTPADTIPAAAIVMFEDVPLEAVMKEIAKAYNVEVRFTNKKTASLRLYYRLNTALSLDEVISQLNTFGHIDIKRNENTIIIY
ncbi:MAG: DUF4974 domain-containing protein [Muribaculaceae bacterium]|nr:DUF4974 domain-containing protein [Muribaculaceae bacterium]